MSVIYEQLFWEIPELGNPEERRILSRRPKAQDEDKPHGGLPPFAKTGRKGGPPAALEGWGPRVGRTARALYPPRSRKARDLGHPPPFAW